MIPIPGLPWIKLLGFFAVGLVIWLTFKAAERHFETVRSDREALAQARITAQTQKTQLEYMARVASIQKVFQDEKMKLAEQYLGARQDGLDRQRDAIDQMGNAQQMAEVAEAENQFSTGSERLTYRARRATEQISNQIEEASRHDGLYTTPDPLAGM